MTKPSTAPGRYWPWSWDGCGRRSWATSPPINSSTSLTRCTGGARRKAARSRGPAGRLRAGGAGLLPGAIPGQRPFRARARRGPGQPGAVGPVVGRRPLTLVMERRRGHDGLHGRSLGAWRTRGISVERGVRAGRGDAGLGVVGRDRPALVVQDVNRPSIGRRPAEAPKRAAAVEVIEIRVNWN